MADTTFHTTRTTDEPTYGLRGFFAWIWRGIVAMGENSSRYRRLEALNAMTDAQLAQRGIKRDDIVRHVFADVFYV